MTGHERLDIPSKESSAPVLRYSFHSRREGSLAARESEEVPASESVCRGCRHIGTMILNPLERHEKKPTAAIMSSEQYPPSLPREASVPGCLYLKLGPGQRTSIDLHNYQLEVS